MARGPLPNPQARRRNAPTIPTTQLPAGGRKGKAPACPYELQKAGAAWWAWAWASPQAAAWDSGALYGLARRAQLEDDLAALELVDHLDVDDLLAGADPEAVQQVEWALRTLRAAATGRLAVMKEMRELDTRFGLNAKAMADLRWSIAPDGEAAKAPRASGAAKPRTLRAV